MTVATADNITTVEEARQYIDASFGNVKSVYDEIVNAKSEKAAYCVGFNNRYIVKECFPWIDMRIITNKRCGEVASEIWKEYRA